MTWCSKTERRGDRMPKMNFQPNQNGVMMDAMLDDLGIDRVNQLPLDGHEKNNNKHDRTTPRSQTCVRRPPPASQRSEALNQYIVLGQNGINDSEAQAVKGLDTLGGPNHHRSVTGQAYELNNNRRPNLAPTRGMQTSASGMLLIPGAPVHRHTPNRPNMDVTNQATNAAVTQKAVASKSSSSIAPNSVAPKASQQSATEGNTSVPGSRQIDNVPPHLRKKNPKPQPPTGLVVQSSQQRTSSMTEPATMSEATGVTQAERELHATATEALTPKVKEPRDDSWYSGTCTTTIPGRTSQHFTFDFRVMEHPEISQGQAMFLLKQGSVIIKSYNIEGFSVIFHKNEQCIVRVVPTGDQSFPETRYSLKFPTDECSNTFINKAMTLQNLMKFIRDTALEGPATASPKPDLTPKQVPVLSEAAAIPATSAQNDLQTEPSVGNTQSTPMAPSKKEAGDVDASSKMTGVEEPFGKLSLDQVKTSSMYKDAPKHRYTSRELIEQRSAGEIPAGLEPDKIPLQKNQVQIRLKRPAHSRQAIHNNGKAQQNQLTGATDTRPTTAQPLATRPPAQHPELSSGATQVKPDVTPQIVAETPSITKVEVEKTVAHDAADEVSLISLQAVDSEDSAVVIEGVSSVDQDDVKAGVEVLEIDNGATKPPTATATTEKKETIKTEMPSIPAADGSAQSIPSFPTVAHLNYLHGVQNAYATSVHDMPSQMDNSHTSASQKGSPLMGMHQMIHQFPGMDQLLPTDVIHAVSVTYHITRRDTPGSDHHGQTPATQMHRGINTGFSQTNTFSPQAPDFSPIARDCKPTAPRTRRGLEGSIFATGYSSAKFAGNFTGGLGSQ